MRRDEVDGRRGAAAVVGVEIGRTSKTRGEFAQGGGLAAPEVADRVAVLAVPLTPDGREVAHLVAIVADIPGLGDELDLADHRVLLDQVEEGRELGDIIQFARERRGEVEAETVDVHLRDPIAQRIHDELQRVRVTDVEGVTGAGVVHVVRLVALDDAVIRLVVDTAESDGGAQVVALGGVVVDHIEDDLEACGVKAAHHGLKLGDDFARLIRHGVVRLGREETKGVVAPVVAQADSAQTIILEELVDWHELDRGDA